MGPFSSRRPPKTRNKKKKIELSDRRSRSLRVTGFGGEWKQLHKWLVQAPVPTLLSDGTESGWGVAKMGCIMTLVAQAVISFSSAADRKSNLSCARWAWACNVRCGAVCESASV